MSASRPLRLDNSCSLRNRLMPNKPCAPLLADQATRRTRSKSTIFSGSVRLLLPLLVGVLIITAIAIMSRLRDTVKSGLAALQSRVGHVGSSKQAAERQISSTNAFALDLFAQMASSKHDVFYSPLSVLAALGMTLAGSTQGSNVEQELVSLLHGDLDQVASVVRSAAAVDYDSKSSKHVNILLANSVWVTSDIKREYVSHMSSLFDAQAQMLPDNPDPVNQWVSKATNGMIPLILDDIDPDTIALLINAIYFKGTWTKPFDSRATLDAQFHPENGSARSVRMMRKVNTKLRYGEAALTRGKLRIVEMPYGEDEEFAAVIALPADGASLAAAISDLQNWSKWIGSLSDTPVLFEQFGLPRFKVEFGAESLKEPLIALGVTSPWKEDVNRPKFDRLSPDPGVYLSDVIHKAVVEVTEEGTTAAAASAAVMLSRGLPLEDPLQMIVDRPFLFAITNKKNNAILFLGRIDNPVDPK